MAGSVVPASASPHVVGKWAVEAAVDPEEMLVAGPRQLSHAVLPACGATGGLHRLPPIAITRKGRWRKSAQGKQAITKVVLNPQIEWTGAAPDDQKLEAMHHEAHDMCFITNSVKTEVSVAGGGSQS